MKLFDYTYKISIDDIKKANNKNKEKKKVKRIASPYTIDKDSHRKIPNSIIYGIIVLIICIIGYCIVLFMSDDNNDNKKDINNKDVAYIYK